MIRRTKHTGQNGIRGARDGRFRRGLFLRAASSAIGESGENPQWPAGAYSLV
jgi:hypothetical protein